MARGRKVMHTIVLPLRPTDGADLLLDRRIEAGFQIHRATVHEGNRRLALYRESRALRLARQMPQTTPAEVAARNAALTAVREAVGLTYQGLQQWAAAARKRSGWLAQHIDAVSVNLLAERAWESLTHCIFTGRGTPRLPRREKFRAVTGAARNPTLDSWRSITLRGRYQDPSDADPRTHRAGWDYYDGPLVMVWNATWGKSRELVVPVKLASPATAKGRREAHALADPSRWRTASVVRTRYRRRTRFELHLTVEGPAYVPAGRYDDAPASGRTGVDIGVSSAACVSVQAGELTSALLINRTPEDRERDRATAQHERRLQRAMDRSLRATNPEAFDRGSRRKGARRGAGSWRPGARLQRSRAYREKRSAVAELRRVRAAERERRINEWAVLVVSQMGRDLVVESVEIRNWAKLWGRSISAFAPGKLGEALRREALKAGGSFTLVSTRTTKLSQSCVCGAVVKKPLSQRTHSCDCAALQGRTFHRDLFSGFLHTAVRQEEVESSTQTPTTAPAAGAPQPSTTASGTTRDVLDVPTAQRTLGDVAAAERLLGTAASRPGQLITADMLAAGAWAPAVRAGRNLPRQRRGAPASSTSGEVAVQPVQTLDPTDVVATGAPSGASRGEGCGKSATAGAGTRPADWESVRLRDRDPNGPVLADG